MAKPMMVIRGPVTTRSGYGDMARDIVRHLIAIDKWDIKVLPCPWGQTPMNALTAGNPKDQPILDKIVEQPNFSRKPEIFISITVPNEFQNLGQYNIGITAGIETTACSPEWVQGMNRMNVIFTISEHSKAVLTSTSYQVKDQQQQRSLQTDKPVEVLHCCVDTDIFHKVNRNEIEPLVNEFMSEVKESFVFLFVGHWLQGDIGQDRKDVGMLIKTFLEVFRHVPKAKRPALILKTSGAGFSVLDREEMLKKIDAVRATIAAQNLPSIYLLHGDLTEPEMNSLYNHSKIKMMISFTKGEGFGRPLLEFCVATGKPIITSGWSGHMDFLNLKEAILLSGKLAPVHASVVWKGVINEGTQWFQVDYHNATNVMHHVWKQYKLFRNRGMKLAKSNAEKFSFEVIQQRTAELMEKYIPKFVVPDEIPITLPTLPKLKKIGKKKVVGPPTNIEKTGLQVLTEVKAQVQAGAKASRHETENAEGAFVTTGEEINA